MALVVPIVADTSGLARALNNGTSGLRKFAKTAALIGVAVGGVLAVGLVKSIKSASDLNEEISKSGVVFGKSAYKIQAWSKTTSTALGMSERMSLQAASTFALFARSAGLGGDETVKFSTQMVKLAADLASFNNSTPEESILAIGAALRGENEPIRRFGVLLDDASLRTEALKQGLIETTKDALTPQQKVLAAHALILQQTTTAQGDFERTSEGLANQQRIVKAQIENLSATLGTTFLPIVARAVGAFSSFIKEFSAQPTFKGKVSFVIDRIRDFVGDSYDNLKDWWTKSKTILTPGSPIPIVVGLSGRQEVEKGFKELQDKAALAGGNAGKNFANSFFERGVGGNFSALFGKIFDGLKAVFRYSGAEAALTFIGGFVVEFTTVIYNRRGEIGDAIKRAFDSIDFTEAAKTLGAAIVKGPDAQVRKKFVGAITDTVREAVNAARRGLAGLGGTLGGMLATITGTSSPEAKQAAAIRKQQKVDAAAREKTRLESALATAETDDEKKQAQQDLNDFLLEQEATRLEDSVAAQQSANQQAIDDLIASFNRGTISAQDFSNSLDAIIGANRGAELGMAFADGFAGALQEVINAAKDIQSVVTAAGGRPITPVPGTPAADAARAAHAEWKSARDARLKTARDARRTKESDGGTKITPAEQKRIDEIMDAYDKKHPEPIRMAAGGILKRQVFTAGEAGREAVIPLGSSEAMGIMRDALGGGGGATTYNLVINAGLGTNPDELGRVIVESIKRFEKRNGQAFSAPLLSTTQNIVGQTATASTKTDFNRVATLRKG